MSFPTQLYSTLSHRCPVMLCLNTTYTFTYIVYSTVDFITWLEYASKIHAPPPLLAESSSGLADMYEYLCSNDVIITIHFIMSELSVNSPPAKCAGMMRKCYKWEETRPSRSSGAYNAYSLDMIRNKRENDDALKFNTSSPTMTLDLVMLCHRHTHTHTILWVTMWQRVQCWPRAPGLKMKRWRDTTIEQTVRESMPHFLLWISPSDWKDWLLLNQEPRLSNVASILPLFLWGQQFGTSHTTLSPLQTMSGHSTTHCVSKFRSRTCKVVSKDSSWTWTNLSETRVLK